MIARSATNQLQALLGQAAPAAALLSGEPYSGKSVILREVERAASSGVRVLRVRGSSLPPALLAQSVAASLTRQIPEPVSFSAIVGTPPSPGWPMGGAHGPWEDVLRILHLIVRTPDPILLIFDDADPLLDDRRFTEGLRRWWSQLRAHGTPVHMIVSSRRETVQSALTAPDRDSPAIDVAIRTRLAPLSLREASSAAPGWSARATVETYALVGGFAPFWNQLDPSVRPGTNIARLLLEPGARLRRAPWNLLTSLTTPNSRIVGVIHAMASGAERWGDIREAAGAFRTSSELGPYMKALQDAGIAAAYRSLDAPERSRQTRYELRHPILRFWYGVVHGHLATLDGVVPARRTWRAVLAQARRDAVLKALSQLVRQYLELHGSERFPGIARETGALWGDGYDIPAAGTLVTGAVVYGAVAWRGQQAQSVARLIEMIRMTRYGFDRENRIPFIVVRDDPSHELTREVARAAGGVILTARDLVGEG